MKKLLILLVSAIFIIALAAIGCSEDTATETSPTVTVSEPAPTIAPSTPTVSVSPTATATLVASSCETCHKDKDLLKQLAKEPEKIEESGGG